MNYKETLHFARINDIDTGTLYMADEVDSLNLNISDNEFEKICSFLYDIYLHYEEYSANELALAFHYLYTNTDMEIKDILNLSKREFIELGIRYI